VIRLYVKKGVADAVAAECRRLVKGFQRLSRAGPPLNIIVTPTAVIENPDGSRGFGVCVVPDPPQTRVYIFVGGDPAPELLPGGGQPGEAVYAVGHVLLHELVHYEQHRDGRPLTERGVNRRATGLYSRIDALTARSAA
jgi:hypothetical protein